MPLRNLFYITDRLKNIIEYKNLYRKSLIKVPRPSFIVLYNGREKLPPVSQLNLSDSYYGKELQGESGLQLMVTVYNINEEANCELLEKCKKLKEYSKFVNIVRAYADAGKIGQKEMTDIVSLCIEEGILVDFMKEYGTSIVDLLHFELNEEEARDFFRRDGFEEGREAGRKAGRKEGREEGRKEGREEGRKEGQEESRLLIAENMLEKGIDINTVCECTGLSYDVVKKVNEEIK